MNNFCGTKSRRNILGGLKRKIETKNTKMGDLRITKTI